MTAHPTLAATPGEVHPAYQGNDFVTEWVRPNPDHMLADADHMVVDFPRRSVLFLTDAEALHPRLSDSSTRRILTRWTAWAPAPWTGTPFHYRWLVAVDDLGRQVAGEAGRTPGEWPPFDYQRMHYGRVFWSAEDPR